MAECKKNVGRGIISYPCNLEPNHDGPCVARENQPSIQARARWEAENGDRGVPHPGAEPLGIFQGPPKSSAQGLMEHGAPLQTIDTNRPGEGRPLYSGQEESRPSVPTIWADSPLPTPDEVVIEDAPNLQERQELREEAAEQQEEIAAEVFHLPTKTRPGDQPLPTVHDDEGFIQDIVCDDIQARKAVGIERYGTGLQTFNGRNVDLDFYEELLDALMYQKQRLIERAQMLEVVREIHGDLTTLFGSLPSKLQDQLEFLYDSLKP